MRRRKPGGQADPPAESPEDSLQAGAVRVVFIRRHQHRGKWYDPGDALVASPAEVQLLRAFAEIELP